jgi:hypothetical protein
MAWKIVSTAAMAAGLLGCSVHSQSSIRSVAYDYSDHAYYDRGYAPSPSYAVTPVYYEGNAPVAAHSGCSRAHDAAACECGHDHSADNTTNRRRPHVSRGGRDRADDAGRQDSAHRPARPRLDVGADDRRAGTADGSDTRSGGASRTRPVFTPQGTDERPTATPSERPVLRGTDGSIARAGR